MRRTLLLTLIIISGSVFSQELVEKSTAGKFTLETFVKTNSDDPFKIDQIRIRHFITKRSALRLTTLYDKERTTKNENFTETESSVRNFDLSFGFENHFGSWEQVSPFWGIEFATGSKKSFSVTPSVNRKIVGALDADGTDQGFKNFSARLVMGVDFYPANGFYLGTEMTFGFSQINFSDIEEITFGTNLISEGHSEFNSGLKTNGLIRVGFVF
jgi:hypothetical protein